MATRGEVGGTCNDTIVSWCLAHGYSADQAAVLETEGVESFALITELDDDDKRGFASALGFSDIETTAFLKAMHSDTTSTYADAISVGLSIDEYRKKLATISTGETDSDICKDDVLSWCLANGYTDTDAGKLAAAGVDSFTFMTELTEDDKADLAADELGLKKFKAKKFLIALNEISARVYAQAIRDGCTFDEYKQELKDARLGKASSKPSTKVRSSAVEPGAAGFEEDEKSGGGESGKKDHRKRDRPTFPEGLHIAEHKVIVLDQEKAMRENPAFKKSDFVALKDLPPFEHNELKIILVVGGTGAGKSTTINSLMNYLYDVQFEDPWRLKLIQEPETGRRKDTTTSQTDQVFGYLIEKPPVMDGKSLLIIDTPGFGDTRGIARDDKTIVEVREFFKTHVLYLNAVCFVVQASDNRECASRKHVYNQVLSLFGKDVEEIITMLFTFADGSTPPAIKVIKKQKINYAKHFKLNNSGFYTSDAQTEDEAEFQSMYWRVGMTSFKKLCDSVSASRDISLEMTRRVLDRRNELQNYIEKIRQYVDEGLTTLDGLKKLIHLVEKCKGLMDANEDFVVEKQVVRVKKVPKTGAYNTVCSICSETCHEDCAFDNGDRKRFCSAMDRDLGTCKYCASKCSWTVHKNLDYSFTRVKEVERTTMSEVKAKYVKASSEKSEYEQVMEGARKEFNETQTKVNSAILKTKEAVQELSEIALRPSTMLDDDDYFNMMIKQEKDESKLGWEDRVDMLEKLRDRSKLLSEVVDDDWDPFQDHLDKIKKEVGPSKVISALEAEQRADRARGAKKRSSASAGKSGDGWVKSVIGSVFGGR